MTVVQAAKVIGCTVRNVRALIAAGKLVATMKPRTSYGYTWDLDPSSVRQFAKLPQQGPGYPRGRARKPQGAA